MKKLLLFSISMIISLSCRPQQLASSQTTSSENYVNYNVLTKDYSSVDEYALSLKKRYTDLDELADDLTKNYTDEADKVRAIYRWVTDNIAYDSKDYLRGCPVEQKLQYAYKEPDDYRSHFAEKVLRSKKGICGGYAVLFTVLCQSAGIKCGMAEGLADSDVKWIRFCRKYHCYYPDHAWNKVRVNGAWYFVDLTWSSGTCSGLRLKYQKNFNNNYYLTPISQLYDTHVEND